MVGVLHEAIHVVVDFRVVHVAVDEELARGGGARAARRFVQNGSFSWEVMTGDNVTTCCCCSRYGC